MNDEVIGRLVAALGASAALHAGLIAGLQPHLGTPGAAGAQSVLHAALRADAPREVATPAGLAARRGEPPLLPVVQYYKTRELDAPLGIMTRVEPAYPDAAARRFLSGKVVMRLFIDEAGRVERVATVRADPPGYFEAAAERAFRGARFTPGTRGGKPVRVQMTLEVSFESPPPPPAQFSSSGSS